MGNAILLQFYEQNKTPGSLAADRASEMDEVILAHVHFNKKTANSQCQLFLT
jgi:hypothetical protein